MNVCTPDDFTKQSFGEAVKAAHAKIGVPLKEVAVFQEKHTRCRANGERLPHLNALTRCDSQHQWKGAAAELYATERELEVSGGHLLRPQNLLQTAHQHGLVTKLFGNWLTKYLLTSEKKRVGLTLEQHHHHDNGKTCWSKY